MGEKLTRYVIFFANSKYPVFQCTMCHYEKKKEGVRKENLDNERDVRMSDTRMVIAYSPVRGIFKTRAGTRTGNRVDEQHCGDFHTRGLDREPEFAGVLEIIKRGTREMGGEKKEKKGKKKKERKYRESVNDIVFRL